MTPDRRLLAPVIAMLALTGAVSLGRAEPGDAEVGAAQAWPTAQIPTRDSAQARAIEARITTLLARMSLEQKVGQMVQPDITYASPSDVRAFHIGSVLSGGGVWPGMKMHTPSSEWLGLAESYYAASMEATNAGPPIPVVWATDAVHGHNNVFEAVIYPHNIGLGAANDPALVEQMGHAIASEVRSTGIQWAFAPAVSVVSNLRWGRSYEGFGDDPALVSRLGAAYVRGLQGTADSSEGIDADHVMATAKHFIGDGATRNGIDEGDVAVSESVLRDRHGPGYYAALNADVQTVMVSFNSWNAEKMHANRYLLTDVLKNRMGFDGVVISDWNAVGQVPGCSELRCPQAINAGVDIIMAPKRWRPVYTNLLVDAKSGVIAADRIDDAVRRILRVKLRMGLFDRSPAISKTGARRVSTVGALEHRELARRAVRESLVLLKNEHGVLPLSPKLRVLVAGASADSLPRQIGGWSLTWQGDKITNADFPTGTSIYQGLAAALRAGGGSAELEVDGRYSQKPDVAVVVFGEEPYAEMRGDRRDLGWSTTNPADLAMIRRLKAQGIPVVSVFVSGRPLWTSPEINASDAFVAAWLPGTEGGGVADLLVAPSTGAIAQDFTGRLPFAWPLSAVVRADAAAAYPVGYGLSLKDLPLAAESLPEVSGLSGARHRSQTVFFDRGPVAPWRVFVGDEDGWHMELLKESATSPDGILSVRRADHLAAGDALHARWNGGGQAQLYLQAGGRTDWSEVLKTPQRLAFSVNVHERPTATVTFRVECVFPCGAKADITRLFRVSPLDQWARVTVDANCMAAAGLESAKVDIPFLINTTGKLEATFSYIDLEPAGPEPPTISCGSS